MTENPLDKNGPGFDDEKGDVPGEQAGEELDIHADNRPRNSDGTFTEDIDDELEQLISGI